MPLKLPVICFHQDYALLLRHWDDLTITTGYGLKHGKLKGLLLVDSDGMAVRVKDASKLHGVGLFGGYDIFLNQRIKVELSYEGEPYRMSLEDFKKKLFESFEVWHGWSSSANFEELREKVRRATSIKEIFDYLFST